MRPIGRYRSRPLRCWATLLSSAALLACGGRAERTGSDPSQSNAGNADSAGSEGSASDSGACIETVWVEGLAQSPPCEQSSQCCGDLCAFHQLASTGVCIACVAAGQPCGGAVDKCCGVCGFNHKCLQGGVDSPCRNDDDCASGFCFLSTSNCLPIQCDPRLHPEVSDPRACGQ